jgi:glutamine phosphoribosylpyrophosphate amidotransferase
LVAKRAEKSQGKGIKVCAIIGYKGKFDQKLVEKLCYESRIRGLHAYGFSYYDNGALRTFKTTKYAKFIDELVGIKPETFVAHFRYSTSGDYTNPDNNQPLVAENTSLVFNGTISMKTKPEMELEFGIKLPSENDGWVLMSRLNDASWLKSSKLSYASAWLHFDALCARKNRKRPLWHYLDGEKVVVASTSSIFERAGVEKAEELKSDVTYRW